MLKVSVLLFSLLLPVGLVSMFGFVSLAVCFGLALLTLLFSTAACPEEQVDLEDGPKLDVFSASVAARLGHA